MARKKTATSASPAEAAFRGLLGAYGLLNRVMHPYFARFGISGAQWGVLRVLRRAEGEAAGGLRLTDLGRRLLIRPPSVTGVVDRLQRLGWVQRSSSSSDRRAKYVGLTPAGRALVERVRRGHARQVEAVLGGLSRKEQADLGRLLARLTSHLREMAGRR